MILKKSRIPITILAGGVLIGVLLLLFRHVPALLFSRAWEDGVVSNAVVVINDVRIPVEIARTSAEQEAGLSNTVSLPETDGKLFVFNTPDRYGFWMKDMHYGLDIIWIDSDHRIVDVTERALPETYPTIFYPSTDVRYVLEVNAGFSTQHSIKVGDVVTLEM